MSAKKTAKKSVAPEKTNRKPRAKSKGAEEATKSCRPKNSIPDNVTPIPGKMARVTDNLKSLAVDHGVPFVKEHGKTMAKFAVEIAEGCVKSPAKKKFLGTIKQLLRD